MKLYLHKSQPRRLDRYEAYNVSRKIYSRSCFTLVLCNRSCQDANFVVLTRNLTPCNNIIYQRVRSAYMTNLPIFSWLIYWYWGRHISHDWFVDTGTIVWSLIARFMGPTWGPSGAGRTQVGPMLAPWTLLSWIAVNGTVILSEYFEGLRLSDIRQSDSLYSYFYFLIRREIADNFKIISMALMLSRLVLVSRR